MCFQRVCCWFAEAFDLGVLSGVEPCADVIVSAAASRRPPNIGARRRGGGGGGGEPQAPKYRGAAAGARRRERGGGGETFLTWGFCPGVLSGVEPCAEFVVSAAAHREILVGGGALPAPQNKGGRGGEVEINNGRGPGAGG